MGRVSAQLIDKFCLFIIIDDSSEIIEQSIVCSVCMFDVKAKNNYG